MRILLLAIVLGYALQGIAQEEMIVPYQSPVKTAMYQSTKGVKPRVPYQQPALMTVYTYDTVRTLAEINTPACEAFPWLSPDGLRLYFRASPSLNLNPAPIYLTQRADTNSIFAPPVQVMVSANTLTAFSLSNDELDIYFSGYPVRQAHRNSIGSAFPQATPLILNHPFTNTQYFNGVTLDPTQNSLFCSLADQNNIYRFCEFTRTSAASFQFVREITLPAGYLPTIGQLSKDGLTCFIDADDTINNTRRIYQLSRPTLSDSFNVSTFQEVHGLNDTSAYHGMASTSDNLDWVVFVRSSDNTYLKCDIYLAHRAGGIITGVNPELNYSSLSVFPNPSSGRFRLRSDQSIMADVSVYSVTGQRVFHQPSLVLKSHQFIDLSMQQKGIYFLRVATGKGNTETRKLVIE